MGAGIDLRVYFSIIVQLCKRVLKIRKETVEKRFNTPWYQE